MVVRRPSEDRGKPLDVGSTGQLDDDLGEGLSSMGGGLSDTKERSSDLAK